MTVCIAVADIDESNGAEEIWPGSHRDLAAASFVAGDMLACSFCSRMKLNCFSFALSNEKCYRGTLGRGCCRAETTFQPTSTSVHTERRCSLS